MTTVVRATKVEGSRLVRGEGPSRDGKGVGSRRSFTRLDLSAPSEASHPIIEVETPAGVKLRMYRPTPEAVGLLSSLCGIGGAA
jgi:hypothetical protein